MSVSKSMDFHDNNMENSSYPFITPSSTCLSEDLLFFDTFSHSGSEKDNFDLVQFPSPVIIDLIKIIPLGQPIEAKIPGNVRLGATNPSNCELEFFINDLSKQDAHTMTDLGKFYCSEKETDFSPPLQIQTDGLLLRGSYRTLTLAIFGQIATFDEKIDDEQVLLSATSPPAQTPASPVASERDIPYMIRSVDHELIRRARDESESIDESTLKSGEMLKEDSLTDNVELMEHAIVDDIVDERNTKDGVVLDETSGSEIVPEAIFQQQQQQQQQRQLQHEKRDEDVDYSNSADLDSFYRRPNKERRHKASSLNSQNDQSDDEEGAGQEWSFEADLYQPKPMKYFADPSMTLQERSILAQRTTSPSHLDNVDKEVEKVKEMFDVLGCPEETKTDDWVTLIEDLTNDIANMSLSRTVSHNGMLKFLTNQVSHGLDMQQALKQKQTGFKVRHLRAGIKLATILFHSGRLTVSALLEASVPQKVLNLYYENQMSTPIRLLILRCLSAACDTPEGVEHVIKHKYVWDKSKFCQEEIRKQIFERETCKKEPVEKGDLTSNLKSPNMECENDKTVSNRFAMRRLSSQDGKLGESDIEEFVQTLTCYQALLMILLTRPTTRVTIAIGNLMKKISLYQNLSNLHEVCQKEAEETEDSVFDSVKVDKHDSRYFERNLVIMQNIVNLTNDCGLNIAQPARFLPAKVQFQVKPNSSDIHLAVYKWLKHFNILECLNSLIRASPMEASSNATLSAMIDYSVKLQGLCLIFMQQILNSPKGTQFFLSNDCYEVTGRILRTLAEKQPPRRSSHIRLSDGIDDCLGSPSRLEGSLTTASCHNMSLKLAYSFKVFSCIDKLFYFHREIISKRVESSLHAPEKVLHKLYIMADHPYGLMAIVKHFSCIGNLDCLLRFIDMPDYHKQLEFVKETSIDYTLEIVGTFLRLNNNVLEIADEYLDTICELCKTKDKTLSARIKSLLPWLSPFNTDQPFPLITYSEETFRQLTRVIRKSIPNYSIPFAKSLNFELPPQMITAVRILRQLCIPPQVESFIEANFDIFSSQRLANNNIKMPSFMAFVDSLPHQQNQNQSWNLNLQMSRNNGPPSTSPCEDSIIDQIGQISNTFKLFQPYEESICGELKYHYGIMQMFEQEGLKRLLNTLRELVGNYPRPIYQSAALSGLRGRIVISYIHSVIVLLHSIICHLIDTRGSEFKDTSIIPVILETYSLLCFVPKPDSEPSQGSFRPTNLASLQRSITLRTDNYQYAQQTKKLILSILMSYTQMCLSVSESEEKVISKSMWTKMLKEVLDFTMSTPVFFHHGLDVLTKILPSPLPCSSVMDSIDQEQLFKNINHRKLWSAHLHPLHQQIEQMISYLCICYQRDIRTLLYYLCNQLCDLSSNAACMVAKVTTDTLISCASKLTLDSNGNLPSPDQQQQQPPQTQSHQQQQQQPQDQSQQTPVQQQLPQNQQQQLTAPQSSGCVEDRLSTNLLSGTRENAYAVKMILNLLSSLITNQAFETAFINHLQALDKKDEKLLANLQNILKLHEDYKPGEPVDDTIAAGGGASSVSHLIDSIKAINNDATNLVAAAATAAQNTSPPEELTKINLLELSRKTTDRSFSLQSGLKKTYRLKVLLDMNSRAHRSSESSSVASKRFDPHTPYNYQELAAPGSHKAAYAAPALRGRGRTSARPDSFRSRPQNTSRPPSIHVDDFIDIYNDGSSAGSNRFPSVGRSTAPPPSLAPPSTEYRGSSRNYPLVEPTDHRHSFFSGGPQPPGSPYGSSSSGGRKSKYLK